MLSWRAANHSASSTSDSFSDELLALWLAGAAPRVHLVSDRGEKGGEGERVTGSVAYPYALDVVWLEHDKQTGGGDWREQLDH